MVNVVKWDGRREPFQTEKVKRTLLRLGAPLDVAKRIAGQIKREAYEGIHTQEILDMAYDHLKEHKPEVKLRRDFRAALAEMRSMPDFEEYVRIVLRAHGYKVTSNRVIEGFCVSHEIDGVAEKDGKILYLEVKHHSDPHIYTPFDVTLAVKAKWDDMKKGSEKGLNNQRFDGVLLVCNTKLTEHARKYANCVGLYHLGWNEPFGRGFERLIEEKNLYPISILKSLTKKERTNLSDAGILTLRQLITKGLIEIEISQTRRAKLVKEAKRILNIA